MKKETYFQKLYQLLRALPDCDRNTIVAFYQEIVEDKMESGLSEEEAVASLGDVNQLAQKILLENPQRRPSLKPIWIALGVVVAILVVLGVWTALGIVTYQELRTNSVAEQVLPSKGHSESFSSMSEEILQGDERETSSKKDTVGKHMEEYRAPVHEVDAMKFEAENKSITFEAADTEEIVISYETDSTQLYTVGQKGSTIYLENKDQREQEQKKGTYRIVVQLPTSYLGGLDVKIDNGKIEAKDLQQLTSFFCETQNATIDFDHLGVENLCTKTRNGKLILRAIQADQQIELSTSNGAIHLEDCISEVMNLESKNGFIALHAVQATQAIQAETTNGAISLEGLQSPDIQLKTVNGEVAGTIYGNQEDYQIITEQRLGKKNLENKSTGTKKLQVTTDLGRIQITFDTNNA